MVNEPYLFERSIGQQMGNLCRLAVGDAKVTQTGEIVTLEDMSERGTMGVSVEVPYSAEGYQSVSVTRCGKNLYDAQTYPLISGYWINTSTGGALSNTEFAATVSNQAGVFRIPVLRGVTITLNNRPGGMNPGFVFYRADRAYISGLKNNGMPKNTPWTFTVPLNAYYLAFTTSAEKKDEAQLELGSTATDYEPYNGDTYTITLPADFYGGTVDLTAGTVTSLYAQDGSLLPEPVVSDIDPVTIPILAGVNNLWADVGTMTVSYYRADAEKFRPALWYPTIYRGLQSARYLIKSASGAVASFSDAIAAPLVGLRVALPWSAEGRQRVTVSAIGYDRTTKWGGIQYDVDSGAAASKYAIGSEIEDTWGQYTAPWTVVNHYANGNMALQWKFAAPNAVQFDAPEAIYYADENGLPAGTYHINVGTAYGSGWTVNTHIQFTLTRAMEEGDQLFVDCATNNANDPSAGRAWRVYHAGGTTVLESGTTSSGEDGTLLGVIGNVNTHRPNGQLNAISRVVYGYARWSQSGIRQYYNSLATKGNWWTLKNPWDRPPSQHTSLDGFLGGFSEEFLSVLKEVDVVTAINTREWSAVEYETTQDKIFLPSLQEMYITPQLANVEGEDWDYYKTLAAEAGLSGKFAQYGTHEVLKKYNLAAQTSSVTVWLRSCYRGYAANAWYLTGSGNVNLNTALTASRGCPACIIQKSGGAAETTITLPTTIYGGYLDAVTGQLVATHDENGNLLTNQKLYFLPPVNIDALAGTNNVWSDAGNVTVSYRVEQ